MWAVSIRQPFAWAILRGGKNIENRSRRLNHRGLLMVHASQQYAAAGARGLVEHLAHPVQLPTPGLPGGDVAIEFGALIGAVQVVGCHTGCGGGCSPWAEPGLAHLELADPIVLTRPVPVPGRLGRWAVDDITARRVREVWPR